MSNVLNFLMEVQASYTLINLSKFQLDKFILFLLETHWRKKN